MRRHWIAIIAFFALTTAGWSQDSPAPPVDPPPEPPPPTGRPPTEFMGGGGGPPGFEAIWYPKQSVRDSGAELGFIRQGLNVGMPVWRQGGDMLLARVGVRHTLFQTDAVLPDSLRPFPEQLWNLNFGLSYLHKFDNGWSTMLLGGFGSASDRPFHSMDEVTANLGGLVRIPASNDRDHWQLGAMYIAGGPVNFPLPIIAYGWNPSERFRMNIGVPLTLFWQPADDWTLNLSYMPLLNINARLTYRPASWLQVFGGYEFVNESYFLADRDHLRDRFFVLEQRLITGIRRDIGQFVSIEMNGGYSFGRRFGEGDSQWSSLRDRVDVESGAFVGAAMRLRF